MLRIKPPSQFHLAPRHSSALLRTKTNVNLKTMPAKSHIYCQKVFQSVELINLKALSVIKDTSCGSCCALVVCIRISRLMSHRHTHLRSCSRNRVLRDKSDSINFPAHFISNTLLTTTSHSHIHMLLLLLKKDKAHITERERETMWKFLRLTKSTRNIELLATHLV